MFLVILYCIPVVTTADHRKFFSLNDVVPDEADTHFSTSKPPPTYHSKDLFEYIV